MISAIVISFFDHDAIKDCLASLTFVDEVIIVGKMDAEVVSELKHAKPIQFLESEAVDIDTLIQETRLKTTHDWTIVVEANKSVSKELSQEVNAIILSENHNTIFKVKTNFNFMGKLIKFSGYKTSYTPLFFYKNSLLTNASTQILKHPIDELYLGFDIYNERLTHRSKQEAQLLYTKNIRPNFIHFLCKPIWKTMTNYIFKLGFLDGKEGFVLAYLKGFKVFKTYLFLWLLHRNIE